MTHSTQTFSRRSFLATSVAAAAASTLASPALADRCRTPAFGRLPLAQVLEHAKRFNHWSFNPNVHGYLQGSPVQRGAGTHWISLKARPPIKFLQYESQPNGINLGWTNNASAQTERAVRRFFLVRARGGTGVVRYGERFALGWDRSKPFIRYTRRDKGINLGWSASPAYEWTIVGGPTGGPVAQGGYACLFNTTHNMPMHYWDRSRAGHIGWPDSNRDFWTRFGTGYISTDHCTQEVALRAVRFLANG